MVQPMLFLHWKQMRVPLALFVVAAFGLPLFSVQGLGTPPGLDGASLDAYRLMATAQAWLPLFPILAGSIGITLALSAWNWDHQQNHVYSLSLPLTRWEYTLQKLMAGAILALVPAAALWIGAQLATASVTLPDGLNAYPNQLATRFFFAIVLSYALLFAMAAGTVRTTLWVAGVVFGFAVFGNVINSYLGVYFDFFATHNVVEMALEWTLSAPGPFEVFTGSWALIDV